MQAIKFNSAFIYPAIAVRKTAFAKLIKLFVAALVATVLFVAAVPGKLSGQAPSISYAGPKNYVINTAITSLSPSNGGGTVASAGYSSTAVNIFSGTSYGTALAFDAAGNIYTFDYSVSNNYKLVKLSPTGTNPVTLISFLSRPEDIAIDPSGNLFVLDDWTIYKVTPGGTVSTFQTVSAANGIGLDAAGNVYVARYSTSPTSILEFPANGGSSIDVGSGLSFMTDVAVDAAGNVYVCNDGDASIKKIAASDGSITTIASGFTSFSASDLTQIIVDAAGNIFFTERNGAKVSEIPAGSNTPIAIGSGFFAPAGLLFDATGNLFVSDNGTLMKFAPVGGYFISPTLPAGLNFNSNTGVISGTPTALSAATDYTITATNSSGSSSATVRIAVLSSAPSTDAYLTSLTIGTGTLSQAFSKATFSYTVNVPNSTTSVTLVPITEDAGATIVTYGGALASGATSTPVPLAVGSNIDHLVVTAQDGVTKNVYSVNFIRADTVLTSLQSLLHANSTPSNLATVNYTATFGVPVSGLTAANFQLALTGALSSATIGTPATSDGGTTWTIPITTGTGDGTITLQLVNGAGVSPGISTTLPYTGDTYTIDKTAPTASFIDADGSPNIKEQVLDFQVVFSEDVTGVDPSTFNLTHVSGSFTNDAVTVSPQDGKTYNVTVSNVTGNGEARLDINGGTNVKDAAGNVVAATNGSSYFVDQTAPTVSSITRAAGGTNPTSAISVDYTVTFSEAVSGVSTADFTATRVSGTVSGTVHNVTGTGTTYTITVNNITGTGDLRLDLNSSVTNIFDNANNLISGGFTTGDTYTIGSTSQTINSIALASASPTNAASASFTVTFGGAVTGLSATNFSLLTTGTITGTNVGTPTTTDNITWTVPVNTGTGNGNITLKLANSTGLTPGISTSLPFGASAVSIDKTAPTVSIFRSVPNPTHNSLLDFQAVFSKPVSGVDVSDFTLTTSGSLAHDALNMVSVNSTTYNFTVDVTGDGTARVDLNASGTGITDAAGNAPAGFTGGEVFTVDQTPPTIAIGSPSVASINAGAGSVTYTVTYADANFLSGNLTTSDISLVTTGDASGTIGVTGSGTSYTVTISNITGSGTIGISIAAGTAFDIAGNTPPASGPSATFIVYSNDATLSSLVTTAGALTPVFDPNTSTYTASVAAGTTSVTVTPTATNSLVSDLLVRVNGGSYQFVTSGATSTALSLNTGDNTIDVQVTAQDGITVKTYTITVNRSSPTISASGTLAALNTTFGTPSSSTSFSVSGAGMNVGILITPPSGFEVSTNNSSFGNTVTVGAAGTVALTPVYIRLKATAAAGAYSGNIVLISSGASSVNVATVSSTVSSAPITITANNLNKNYGSTLTGSTGSKAYSITSGQLKNGNTVSSVTVSYGTGSAGADAASTYTGSVTPSAAVGSNGFLISNYNITYAKGDIIVNREAMTITARNVTKNYGSTLTGGAGFKTYSITAGQLKNGNTLSSITIAYGAGAAPTDAANTYTGSVTPSAAVGGSGFLISNYNITYTKGDIIVNPEAMTITAKNVTKNYGSTLTGGAGYKIFSITAGQLKNGNTLRSMTIAYGAGSAATDAANTYTGSVMLSAAVGGNGFLISNYNITYVQGDIVVNPEPMTITARNVNKTYGSTLTGGVGFTVYSITSGQLKNGNTLSSVTVAYDAGSASTDAVGTYNASVTPSAAVGANGFLSSNYNITYAKGNIIVGAEPLTIKANDVNKILGATLTGGAGSTAFGITNGSLQNGNTISSVSIAYGTGSAAGATVGTYTGVVTPSGAVGANGFLSSNYAITYAKGSIVVVKPAITASGSLTALSTMQGTPSVSSSFTVSGANINSGILVTPPAGFEVSTDNLNFGNTVTVAGSNTIAATAVYVRLATADAVGQYSGNIVLTSANADAVNVPTASSTVNTLLQTPNVQARLVTFTNTTATNTTISWTSGNGAGRVVFMRLGSTGSALPGNGTLYTANTTFGAGTAIGTTGWYCVYNGIGSSVDVSGLTQGTTYRVTVLEYNGTPADAAYLENNLPPNDPNYIASRLSPANVTTTAIYPVVPARQVTFANTTATSTTASWTNGDGTARVVFMELTGTGSPVLTDGVTYTANTTFGAGATVMAGTKPFYCIYNGTGNSVNITGLSSNTLYRLTVIEYKGTAGSEKYLNTGQSPGNVTTGMPPLNTLLIPKEQGGATPLVSSFGNEKLEVNNILSPNGDGVNDIWVVKNIAFYPDNAVTVYNRAGTVVFSKKGYANDWDGTYRGSVLDEGTYYYTVDLGNGKKTKGFITVVRNR